MAGRKPDDIDLQVAHRIRQVRLDKDITAFSMSKPLGVSYQQYQKMEAGSNRISIGRFVKIAEILGVSPEELLKKPNKEITHVVV